VFFDWDKANLTPEATSTLDNAIQAYANCNSIPVMLAGHADASGKPKYNMALSARRNTAVRGYLNSHGIADAAIASQAFGESKLPVPTADGVREIQNRRVEITYGPGSGN
jgi:outer membrane protein OmpA-like peptidoglycan-associated protein